MEKRDNKQELDIAILQTNYKSMSDKIDNLQEIVVNGFTELKSEIKDNYVSKESFYPIKTIVYGMVGIILIAVLSVLVSQVLK